MTDVPTPRAEQPVPQNKRPWLKWASRAAQAALAVVIVYFIYSAVGTQLAKSHFLSLHFSIGYLVVAWVVIGLYYVSFAMGLTLVIRSLGYRPRFRDIFKLSYATNLGKYLPGGVWQIAGKVALAKQAGVDRHAALVASVVESAVSVVGGLLLFIVTTLFGAPFPATVPKWPLFVLLVVIFVALQPQLFARVVRLAMRILHIEGEPPHLTFVQTVWLVFYYAGTWLIAGAGFWFFTRALIPDPGANWLVYSGFYAAASVGGLLVLFVPAGIGVREGFLVLLMRNVVGGPTAAARLSAAVIIAFAARVWSTAMELALSAGAVAMPFSRHPPDSADEDADAPDSPTEGGA
jgi:uncharacterized membrane protein YbhN (UPF0104 family)